MRYTNYSTVLGLMVGRTAGPSANVLTARPAVTPYHQKPKAHDNWYYSNHLKALPFGVEIVGGRSLR